MSWQYLEERRGFEKLHHLDVQAAEVTYEDREVAPWPFCPQLLLFFFGVNRKGVSPEAVFALLLVLWLWIALTVLHGKVSLCVFSCLHAFFAMVI